MLEHILSDFFLTTTFKCVFTEVTVFPGGSDSKKKSAYNARDSGWIPGSGRSPGEGNGNPLQYSYLGNPRDREAWQAIVHGVTKT